MLPFNALNERNRKQEIGNEASGFYPLSPGQTKETTRRKTMLTSRPKRKVCLHWLPGSVERHSLTAFNLQSKKTTRQQGRLRHTLTSRPIEGQYLTGASPQSKAMTLLVPVPNRKTWPCWCLPNRKTWLCWPRAPIEGCQEKKIEERPNHDRKTLIF